MGDSCGADTSSWPATKGTLVRPVFMREMTLAGGLEHVWLVVWHLLFFHVLGILIPSDVHIFQAGLKPPTRCFIFPYVGDDAPV